MSNRESRSRSPTPRWQSPARTIAPETSQPGSPRDGRVLKESASTDSIACDIVPKLPSILSMREYKLVKRPPSSSGAGWGVVLRGVTSEFVEGTKIYTCHVDSVHEQGAAELCGLKEGDQIVSINGEPIKDYEHSDVVKLFQSRSEVSLVILPAKYKSCIFGRINRVNKNVLSYLWCMGRCLHSLEVIEVNLGSDQQPDKLIEVDLTGLVTLQALSFHHCFLNSLHALKGLHTLNRLEYLSFAHNVLTCQVLKRDCAIASLQSLKKLDLSRNLLSQFPECLFELTNLEVLVLAENNITELPSLLAKLTKLNTLCIDGNLLREVDKSILLLPWIQKLTMSNNLLETESLAVKHRQFLITSVQGNPYTSPDQSGMVTRKEPSLRRTVSVRGILHLTNKQKQRLSVEIDSKSGEEYCGTSSPADNDDIYIATQ